MSTKLVVKELPDGGSPAAESDVLARAASRARSRTVAGSPSTKWNVVSERVNEGRLWWVSTNTGVWNGGSSPHQPRQLWSSHGPRWGPELVAAHDLGADVAGVVSCEVVVEAAAPAGVRAHGPARRGAGPGEHVARVGVAERPLDALVITGTESVTRDVEVLDSQQLIHAIPPELLMMGRLRGPDRLIGGSDPNHWRYRPHREMPEEHTQRPDGGSLADERADRGTAERLCLNFGSVSIEGRQTGQQDGGA